MAEGNCSVAPRVRHDDEQRPASVSSGTWQRAPLNLSARAEGNSARNVARARPPAEAAGPDLCDSPIAPVHPLRHQHVRVLGMTRLSGIDTIGHNPSEVV